jgi:hypothetical protein
MKSRFARVAACSLLILTGCGKTDVSHKKDVIAAVNNEPIYADELRREVALKARQDPTFKVTPETEADQLDTIVNRKLIVQEAMAKGLVREDKFVNTIKAHWEQTLIRDFFDYKRKEFQDYLFATDDDIRRYYENASSRATFKVLRSKDRRDVDEAFARYLTNRDAEIQNLETIGPLDYEDASSNVLQDAFAMSLGEARKSEDPPYYYFIVMAKKDPLDIGPLASIKPEIEKRVIAMKERRLFEEWLKEKRKRSTIAIEPHANTRRGE